MSEQTFDLTQTPTRNDGEGFLARFYRQMGLYAVAATLDIHLDPLSMAQEDMASPAAPAPAPMRDAA